MTFDSTIITTLVATLATFMATGCSGNIPSMSGAPAPMGSAKFGTWLSVTTVYDGSKIRLAVIDVVELRKQKEINIEVIHGDKLINVITITKQELTNEVPGPREEEVSLVDRDHCNGADSKIITDDCVYYYLGSEMVHILIGPGKIRVNRDPNKIIHIETSWSLSQIEDILGPATSKNLPGLKSTNR